MKALVLGLVFAVAGGTGTAMGTKSSKKDLVLIGTVIDIGNYFSEDDPIHNFVVTVTIDHVISGELTGSTYTFPIHSRARAMLEIGVICEVRAKWRRDAYVVAEPLLPVMPRVTSEGSSGKDVLSSARSPRSRRRTRVTRAGSGLFR